ncbi:hypothetical protein IEQ34_021254 [Dendrobium chrysotoxum]|uniref:Uncharacterized protein n=1 Tax=Dendrobium chrysotoxum TaxID=161865 RepID=A0AAV7G4B2_DENCH|nr:hypothetical protein IEQ34_021254 [Dendrobium chrysotoxum]
MVWRDSGRQAVVRQNSGPQAVVRRNSRPQVVIRWNSEPQVVIRWNSGGGRGGKEARAISNLSLFSLGFAVHFLLRL